MSKRIDPRTEEDGYITREADLKETKAQTCRNCRHYAHHRDSKGGICMSGYSLFKDDWRLVYQVCDKWEGKCI